MLTLSKAFLRWDPTPNARKPDLLSRELPGVLVVGTQLDSVVQKPGTESAMRVRLLIVIAKGLSMYIRRE